MIALPCRVTLLACALAGPVSAESVVAARTLRPQHVISPDDLAVVDRVIPGAESDPSALVGRETVVAIYGDQPVRLADTQNPALVERNQVVTLVFLRGGLEIRAEGRALARGGAGDLVQAMNLSSRNKVTGVVTADGLIQVSQ